MEEEREMKRIKRFGLLILAYVPPSVSYQFNSLKEGTRATWMPENSDWRPAFISKRILRIYWEFIAELLIDNPTTRILEERHLSIN
jgi:hypothetical protein